MMITIITFLILILCVSLMSIGIALSNKPLSGSCGSGESNPCTCSIIDRINCQKKINLQ